MRISFWLVLTASSAIALSASAQTNLDALGSGPSAVSEAPAQTHSIQTNRGLSRAQQAEEFRAVCIEGRRFICGRILKVLPDGLVVESGYTNLLRAPLTRSWLAPGTVSATRADGLIEGNEPNAVCIGLVFVTNLPKLRGAKPKLYDYVLIEGYPAGPYTYASLGNVHRTVRKFSASLDAAIQCQINNLEK